MSNFKRVIVKGETAKNDVLSTLRATTLVDSKPFLPAEIISTILDFLSVTDLFRFARASKRMQEMVYDDTRWVQRLRCMGCWNEAEARARFDNLMRKKWQAQKGRQGVEVKKAEVGVNGSVLMPTMTTTLFDANIEQEQQRRFSSTAALPTRTNVIEGFEVLPLSASPIIDSSAATVPSFQDPVAILKILSNVKSVRGAARQEYGRVYAALAPFYFDLARSRSHNDPVIFRVYRDPEQQAQMLAQLQIFALSDWAQGWHLREEKLNTMIGIFENAALREFEQGYENWDIDTKMHKYAHVLDFLNGGQAGIELFIQKHPLFSDRARLGNPMDCINHVSSGSVDLEPSRVFFAALSGTVNEQVNIIERVFPYPSSVIPMFIEKISEDIIGEYIAPLFDEAHERSIPSYLKAVSGVFEQSMQFAGSFTSIQKHDERFRTKVDEIIFKVFEPHVDLYLQEELDYFRREAETHVNSWEKKLSDEDASTESFFMANVNRQVDKKDFLSSFKKVVMMPVNVLPSLPISSPFATNKTNTVQLVTNDPNSLGANFSSTPTSSRPHSPGLGPNGVRSSTPINPEGSTNELTAKAALMASRLAGIKSLFSIEVALTLVHTAKTSLERAAQFVRLGGQTGGEAREQCEMIFVALLQTLGFRHVKSGFDKAVEHLSQYNPREASEHNQNGVAPLVIFLELVNVGDLISQMIDVFYEQQLATTKLTDKNDFLDPAVKAKKKFEQMLDERVAAGLNKGIDVLMDEVEYVCATVQSPSDYNPSPLSTGNSQGMDIGPTQCAEQVVELVSSHTKMLTGSTDKNMLDVFNQEVGLRLFTTLCKHIKRQRISVDGAIKLISDMNLYFGYVQELKNQDLLQYFKALRELSQIYLIHPSHAREMATIIADGERFYGIFRAEEVYEFAERRADWFQVKRSVERAMYGIGCVTI